MAAKLTGIKTRGGIRFTPTWFHAHAGSGFVIGVKGSKEVITIPATSVDYIVTEYDTTEEVEKLFGQTTPDKDTNGQNKPGE